MRLRPLVLLTTLLAAGAALEACTNLLVTKGASKDGSTMITYSADSHTLYGELYFKAGGRHQAGTFRDIVEWDTGKPLGRIPEAALTYTRVGNMNEHQLVIAETTFGGRKELHVPSGIVDYGSLIYIGLERAKTAREAIQVMTSLAETYGYASEGESFSIADPNEVWILEMIGKGKGQTGALWVAYKLPDGTISAHANQARIRQFPQNDPATALFSRDLIPFAREKGWFKGEDKNFSFVDAYAPLSFGALRACEARVWSIFNRAAKSQKIPMDFVKAEKGAKPMPLFIKPDEKLAVQDAMALMRDHYEGTDFDMTKDIGAGPYKLPYRWRPMGFKIDGQDYVHERAISTQQTGFSFVTQSRSWMPDPVGGVIWFGVDDTYTTVYVPISCGIQAPPKAFAEGTGNFSEFNWDSAFWTFNFVSNYTYTRWSDMIVDVQKVQREYEGRYLADQAEVDRTALDLFKKDPAQAKDYLTQYAAKQTAQLHARWRKLGEFLIWKYLDGNVRNEKGEVTHPKAPEDWLRCIVKEHGDVIKVKKVEGLAPDED
ncbi:MAG: C69 family dipeptidase [Geothrix sp.]|uniref:dipeptidase n=1 Tax=Geothrix sp. TaxID=1962974 RepID=UPI0017F991E6|nr:C69 family dipeptidase [Geothrix sp.]NWJ40199.1 C69 family dipeptidase [Geothrix sp.]WIL21793.1 MAG: C69 family dipeptidase [Geothrix sp.]